MERIFLFPTYIVISLTIKFIAGTNLKINGHFLTYSDNIYSFDILIS